MYQLLITYVNGEGYQVSEEYNHNGYNELYQVHDGLTKQEVNELIEKKGYCTPFLDGLEIGFLYE